MPLPINKVLRTILLPAFLLWANALFAQIRHDTLIEIISYGLGVYAKDTFSFSEGERNRLQTISQNIGDPRKLNESVGFLKTNSSSQLKKVGGNMEKWLEKGNTVTTYQPLVKLIEETLTNGGDGPAAKEWRKKNVSNLFTAPVDAYLRGLPEETESEEAAGSQPDESLVPGNTAIGKTTGGNNMLSTMALVLAALSFGGVCYLFFLFSNRLKEVDASRKRQRADIDQLKADTGLSKKNPPPTAAATTTMAPSEERLKQLEAKMAYFESRLKPANAPAPPPPRKNVAEPKSIAESKNMGEPVVAPISLKKAPVEIVPEIKTFFAKRPDLDNGFKQTDFSTSQNGEQAYQIAVNGNTATFMIVNDAHSQKYALSNYRYYLEKACDFVNEPMPNCRIDTKEYGQLEKTGNDWIIQKKAIIEFV